MVVFQVPTLLERFQDPHDPRTASRLYCAVAKHRPHDGSFLSVVLKQLPSVPYVLTGARGVERSTPEYSDRNNLVNQLHDVGGACTWHGQGPVRWLRCGVDPARAASRPVPAVRSRPEGGEGVTQITVCASCGRWCAVEDGEKYCSECARARLSL